VYAMKKTLLFLLSLSVISLFLIGCAVPGADPNRPTDVPDPSTVAPQEALAGQATALRTPFDNDYEFLIYNMDRGVGMYMFREDRNRYIYGSSYSMQVGDSETLIDPSNPDYRATISINDIRRANGLGLTFEFEGCADPYTIVYDDPSPSNGNSDQTFTVTPQGGNEFTLRRGQQKELDNGDIFRLVYKFSWRNNMGTQFRISCNEAPSVPACVDNDGDGYGTGTAARDRLGCPRGATLDCDDTDAAVNYRAQEICGDGIDNDCSNGDAVCPVVCGDGTVDEGEQCDDGNTANEDGCTESCTCEHSRWVTGDGSLVLNGYDWGSWGSHNIPSEAWRGVWGSSYNDVWAVGGYGKIQHWNGNAWNTDPFGSNEYLTSVWGSSQNDVWAVGGVWSDYDDAEQALVLHYDGSTWSTQLPAQLTRLNDVWGGSSLSVWAVGNDGMVLWYDGIGWRPQHTGINSSLRGVHGLSNQYLWAVGADGVTLIYNSIRWESIPSGTTNQLNDVWAASSQDVWAVGIHGTILHWDGSSWTSQPSGSTAVLTGVWGSSPSDVWAVGSEGTVLRYDGVRWSSVDMSFTQLSQLSAISGYPTCSN
jgi:cysteine-rich repeat protein